MAISGVHHVVLRVPDVPDGEACYRELFDVDVLFREGVLDGKVGTVPERFTWEVARSKGVTPTMSFLGRDEFFLAVARGDETGGERRVDHVAVAVDESTFESVTERAEAAGCTVERDAAHHRTFEDPLGFEWELNTSSPPPSRAFDTLEL